MKVSQLIKVLQENNKPDDEIIVLWWEKQNFDFDEGDILELTDEAWLKISNEFDSWDNAGEQIGEWIADAVLETAEETQPSDGGGKE
jgi:hypothetical protein